jgi:hypothetical protein
MKHVAQLAIPPILRQPLVGTITSGLALLTLAVAWLPGVQPRATNAASAAVVAVILVAGVILAYQFPIHIGYRHKVEVNTVPLFLMAARVPPALAATAAGLGILVAELAVRSRRGSYLSDIGTAAGRFVIVTMAGALVAHLPTGGGPWAILPLVGAALTMGIGDILTLPLVLVPMSGDPVLQIIRDGLRESADVEGAQYIVGLLGALAGAEQPWVLILLGVPTVLVYLAFKSAREMHQGTHLLLERIADTIDLRDPYTGGHSRRVMTLTSRVLQELQITGESAPLVVTAARLHDIGKIGVPDHILNKTGPLTAEEWAILQLHPEQGADLLRDFPGFAHGVAVVRHHHERWDGAGYPHHLKERAIPLGARIVAVVDSYDAMTSDRPYRPGLSPKTAAEILRAGRGTQWDPEIVDAFLRVIAQELDDSATPRLKLVPTREEDSESGPTALPA